LTDSGRSASESNILNDVKAIWGATEFTGISEGINPLKPFIPPKKSSPVSDL
jgi:hypothetical protein